MTTIDELKAKMKEALASGDTKAIEEVASAITKGKADRRKVEVEAIQKEAEKLAGAREKLASSIWNMLKGIPDMPKQLEAVKATGFTYKLDAEGITYKAVMLAVPSVKRGAGGRTGGGKSKDEFGMSLGEIFDKFATQPEKNLLAAAPSNSAQWQVKVAVKKRAIKDGLLAPVK